MWADGGRGSGRSAPLAVPDAASAGAVWADAGSGAGGGRQRPEACSGTNYSEIIFHDACAVRIIACRGDVFPQVWCQWNNILSESDASDFRDFGRFVTQSGADRARVCRVKPVCCVVRVTDCDCHREGCVWNMTTIARFLCCVLSLARIIWMVHELSEHICCMAAVAGGKYVTLAQLTKACSHFQSLQTRLRKIACALFLVSPLETTTLCSRLLYIASWHSQTTSECAAFNPNISSTWSTSPHRHAPRTGPLAALPTRPAATLTGAADQLTARTRSARHL